MKKQLSFAGLLILLILIIAFTSCESTPVIFTVNNCNQLLSDSNAIPGIKAVAVKGVEGTWTGMEHRLVIIRDSEEHYSSTGAHWFAPAMRYLVRLQDTITSDKRGYLDTTRGRLLFVKVNNQLWVQFSTRRKERYEHEYSLQLYSFFKVGTIKPDTIFIYRPVPTNLYNWLAAHHYQWFSTDEFMEDNENPPIILTAPAKELPAILNAMNTIPGVIAQADTLVRRK
jgi:hypothetical protein